VRAGLGDGSIARGSRGLQRGVAGGEGVVVRVVAVVGLREALVACCRWPRHVLGILWWILEVCVCRSRLALQKSGGSPFRRMDEGRLCNGSSRLQDPGLCVHLNF